jgi:hypothetical protein
VGAAIRWHDEESQLVAIIMMVDLLCPLPEQLVLYCTYPGCITEKRGHFFPKATSQKCRVFAEKKWAGLNDEKYLNEIRNKEWDRRKIISFRRYAS